MKGLFEQPDSKEETGRKETPAECARRLQLSRARVSQMIRSGMPVRPDGYLNPREVDEWIASNIDRRRSKAAHQASSEGATLIAVRLKRELAAAQLAEIDLKKKSGELIARNAVRDVLTTIHAQHRDGLLVIPERLSPVLAVETDPSRIRSILTSELEEHLNDLATKILRI